MSRKKSKYWGKPFKVPNHPYVVYENTPLWQTVKKALTDLDENQDIELTAWHQYIVGYICKLLDEKDICSKKFLAKRIRRKK